MSNGFVFTEGVSPVQGGKPAAQTIASASDVPNTILQSARLIDSKKKEAQRQFELAQQYMRNDLNTVAGFDVTVAGGGQWAEMLSKKADWARQSIKEANDPVKAAEIISEFRDYYRQFKNTAEVGQPIIQQYDAINKASDLTSYNKSLPSGQKFERSTVQEQIQAQNARDNVFSNVEYDTKGNAYVRDKDGNRTPWQASPLATDFTMFDPKVTTRDVGGLREEAQSTDTKQYIGWSHNGYWNKDEAADIYNNSMNLVETDNQSDAIEFRLKVINDGDALNQNLLTTEEDRVRFMNGDYDSTNPADKKFVRMEDWGRNRFIDLSRFSKTMTAQEEKNRKERGLKVDAVDRLFSGGKSFLLNEYMEGLERSGYDVADTNLVQATYPISDVKAVQVGGEVVVPSVMTIKPNGDIVVKGSVASRAAGSGELEYTDYEREFENGTQEYIDASVSLDQALQSTFGEGYTVDFLSSQEALDRLKEFDLDKATDSVVAGSESTTEQSTQQGPIDASVYNNK
jgi:hypothetical protein